MKNIRKIRFSIAIFGYVMYNIIVVIIRIVRGSFLDDFDCLYESLRGRNDRAGCL